MDVVHLGFATSSHSHRRNRLGGKTVGVGCKVFGHTVLGAGLGVVAADETAVSSSLRR